MGADPRSAPQVPPDVEDRLAQLPGLHPDTVAYAKFLFPDPRTETEVQKQDRERVAAERTQRLKNLQRLAEAAVSGEYGPAAKAAVDSVLTGPLTRVEQLETCGRIVAEARKASYYEQKQQRGRFAP